MADTNPFDDMFDQLRKLLQLIEENAHVSSDEIKIPPDIDKRLRRLEKKVESFRRLGEDIVTLSGVSGEELKMRLQGVSKEVPQDGKELIEKGNTVKRKAENLSDKLETILRYAPASEKNVSSTVQKASNDERKLTDKERSKKRRSKFKRFGSDDKWKPL